MFVHVFYLLQFLASIEKVNEVNKHAQHELMVVGQNPCLKQKLTNQTLNPNFSGKVVTYSFVRVPIMTTYLSSSNIAGNSLSLL